jgi:hypothetical protein
MVSLPAMISPAAALSNRGRRPHALAAGSADRLTAVLVAGLAAAVLPGPGGAGTVHAWTAPSTANKPARTATKATRCLVRIPSPCRWFRGRYAAATGMYALRPSPAANSGRGPGPTHRTHRIGSAPRRWQGRASSAPRGCACRRRISPRCAGPPLSVRWSAGRRSGAGDRMPSEPPGTGGCWPRCVSRWQVRLRRCRGRDSPAHRGRARTGRRQRRARRRLAGSPLPLPRSLSRRTRWTTSCRMPPSAG